MWLKGGGWRAIWLEKGVAGPGWGMPCLKVEGWAVCGGGVAAGVVRVGWPGRSEAGGVVAGRGEAWKGRGVAGGTLWLSRGGGVVGGGCGWWRGRDWRGVAWLES